MIVISSLLLINIALVFEHVLHPSLYQKRKRSWVDGLWEGISAIICANIDEMDVFLYGVWDM